MKQIFIFSDNKRDSISYYECEPASLVLMNREDLPYLKEYDFASFSAIYILIGGDKRYIGQAAGQTILKRLSQHFLDESKSWIDSVIFFSRTDGKLSKADTDYLEKRLIDDFKSKSEFELTNSTVGNSSYIDSLHKAKADHLYETVFEVIDNVANIDLFLSEEETEIVGTNSKAPHLFEIEFNGIKKSSSSARGLFKEFMKEVVADEKYKSKIQEIIIDDCPTSKFILGRRKSSYNGKPSSVEIGEGIWLYHNFSRTALKKKIKQFSSELDIPIRLKWD